VPLQAPRRARGQGAQYKIILHYREAPGVPVPSSRDACLPVGRAGELHGGILSIAIFLSWSVLPLALYTNLPEKFIKKKIDEDGCVDFFQSILNYLVKYSNSHYIPMFGGTDQREDGRGIESRGDLWKNLFIPGKSQ
jgi:hypothetical protein